MVGRLVKTIQQCHPELVSGSVFNLFTARCWNEFSM